MHPTVRDKAQFVAGEELATARNVQRAALQDRPVYGAIEASMGERARDVHDGMVSLVVENAVVATAAKRRDDRRLESLHCLAA